MFAGLIACVTAQGTAQSRPRDVRVEVRDKGGHSLHGVHVAFPPLTDSVTTDSSGTAFASVDADSTLTIAVRKIGYEPRTARFVIGRAPAFSIRVTLGQVGIRLPEVSVIAEYPGEPWRTGYEERRKSSSGSFRDLGYFEGRQPTVLEDWFAGLPGAQMSARGLRVNRCPRLGVWIDGMHVTAPGLTSTLALNQLSAHDIAAIELFRMSQQPSRYSDPLREDCTLLVWTRSR
jgi:hypothetical protein